MPQNETPSSPIPSAVPSLAADRSKVCFLDTETTGLDFEADEVIQLAVVLLDGTVAYEGNFKPTHRTEWPEAERVNRISPESVAEAPSLLDEKGRIEAVLGACDMVSGWNVDYDLKMLRAGGICFPEGVEFCDLMPAFCDAWRSEHPDYPEDRNRERLVRVTEWLGLEHDAHDALGDTVVLPVIWDWVAGREAATQS